MRFGISIASTIAVMASISRVFAADVPDAIGSTSSAASSGSTTAASATASSTAPGASSTASAPAGFVNALMFIKPYNATTFNAGDSIPVTWTFTPNSFFPGVTDKDSITLQLEDLRSGINKGKPLYMFDNKVVISDKQATVVLKSDTPSGAFAIATTLAGTYISSPLIFVNNPNSPLTSGGATSTGSSSVTVAATTAASTTKTNAAKRPSAGWVAGAVALCLTFFL